MTEVTPSSFISEPFLPALWPVWWSKALPLWDNTPFTPPTPAQQAVFEGMAETLYARLSLANQHTNLTRLTSPQDYLYRHLLDSLTLLKGLPAEAKIADVGSGAGFPSLVLAMLGQTLGLDWQLTALEATQKKARFIEESAEVLKLTTLKVIALRAEAYGKHAGAGKFSVVTARAVAPLEKLLPWCIPLLTVKGRILAMKGRRYPEELTQAQSIMRQTRTQLVKTITFSECPELDGSVVLVLGH